MPLFRRRTAPAARPNPRRCTSRPGLEALEGRQLLSLTTPEFLVNDQRTASTQSAAHVATNRDGTTVVVWQDLYGGTDNDIYAQRYDPAGNKLGPMISVDYSIYDDEAPHVAVDDRGDFVAVWSRHFSASATQQVWARCFDSSGVPTTNSFQIKDFNSTTSSIFDPDVAMDSVGDFAVTYTRQAGSNDTDVFLSLYNASGTYRGSSIVANSHKLEQDARVAMAPDGRISVAYDLVYNLATSDVDVYLRQYSASGTPLSTIGVAVSTAETCYPSVGVDSNNRAVVAYQAWNGRDWDLLAYSQRLGYLSMSSLTGINETEASVAVNRATGAFVVGFNSSYYGAMVEEVGASRGQSEYIVANADGATRPSLGMDDAGNYTAAFDAGIWSGNRDVHARRGHLTWS